MPLPIATAACNVPDNVCCDTLWLMGERIRQVCYDAVLACTDESCRDAPFDSWQTEGEASGAVKGNSLVVSFGGLDSAPVERTRRVGPILTPITRATFRVELNEVGWPMIREHSATQTVAIPDPALVSALAKHARGHAEKMWRVMLNAITTTRQADALFPSSTNPHIINRGVALQRLSGGPRGPHVRYSFNVTVDHMLP